MTVFDASRLQDKALHIILVPLFRKIKALSGQSPSEYIRTIRLKRAAQLIKSNFGNLAGSPMRWVSVIHPNLPNVSGNFMV